MVDKEQITGKQRIKRVIYFFPFQLFLYQLRTNVLLLFPWIILFAYITENLAQSFGVPYLFLYPEYLGQVGFTSHLILGFACGGFIMAYNIASYILNGHSFSFIATLSRPFFKFCINNFVIPIGFVIVYCINLASFQLNREFETGGQVAENVLGFLLGNMVFIILSLGYFFTTNKSVFAYLTKEKDEEDDDDKKDKTPARGIFHRWGKFAGRRRYESIHIETYMANFFRIALARESTHYDKEVLRTVFAQNHINASLFELIILCSLVVVGIFRDNPLFIIPAGASVLLIFTVLVMAISALYTWFRKWTLLLVIGLAVLFTQCFDGSYFEYTNYAYGLDYNIKQQYNQSSLAKLCNNEEQEQADLSHGVDILNNWKSRNATEKSIIRKKPKLVIVNSSGGGSRSALWTYHALSHLDSVSGGKFLDRTHIMTGSSGGLLGSAYIRELYLRRQLDPEINVKDQKHFQNIGKDLLNPVCFTIAINDLFPRFQKFSDGKFEYPKDRGYEFEKQFIINTGGILTKRIKDYSEDEYQARIPLFLITPTITNDARRLLISSQPVSYLANNRAEGNVSNNNILEYIEFSRFFKENKAEDLRFSTALRMNATFPYILPNPTLPTEPPINVMDAGLRDNYGTEISLKYIMSHEDWINKNTSGVIILQLRDSYKESMKSKPKDPKASDEILSPVGAVYRNITKTHNYQQDNLLQLASRCFRGTIDVVSLELDRSNEDIISLSWRLTKKEKLQIMNSIHSANNQNEISRLLELLEDE
ncbi:MAG: patatin-like phospholipase family protein [Flavobacteriales bacterium]|nr:patatin-like phospholipase family protein [Flavobacteriales bacterium]